MSDALKKSLFVGGVVGFIAVEFAFFILQNVIATAQQGVK